MKSALWLLPACLLLFPLAAIAASQPQAPQTAGTAIPMPTPPVPKFAQADADGDGKITWKEAENLGVPKKLFQQDDFDDSGDLIETEWMFVRLDMTDFTPPPAPGS
ncbi:MAG: hypothetical protein L0I62_09085 [Gammaproteobacteria bacterium]|nr:hypothetical protein [Gammaproteobacteria bacterium]